MSILERLNIVENGWEPPIRETVLENGTVEYRNRKGELHNENDLPAIIKLNGKKIWCKNNKFHRDNDLPAIIEKDSKQWLKNGKYHRDGDLPAIIYSSGSKFWYKNGKLHRDNDLPAIIWSNGFKEFYKNGKIIKKDTIKNAQRSCRNR